MFTIPPSVQRRRGREGDQGTSLSSMKWQIKQNFKLDILMTLFGSESNSIRISRLVK